MKIMHTVEFDHFLTLACNYHQLERDFVLPLGSEECCGQVQRFSADHTASASKSLGPQGAD